MRLSLRPLTPSRPALLAVVLAGTLAALAAGVSPVLAAEIELGVSPRGAQLSGDPLRLDIQVAGTAPDVETAVEVWVDGGLAETLSLTPGEHAVEIAAAARGSQSIELRAGTATATASTRAISGWLSVIPPLVAIGLALLFKDVILSLLLGIFAGALFFAHWNPVSAFARTIDTFIVPTVADGSQASILIFTSMLGGMIGLISKSGGTKGIIEFLKPYATTPKRAQVASWLLGIAIFFDDYANTLIVGSTMRPITDRLKVSREKLAYIVDSTAAPVVSLFPISTWVGFEVGLIGAAFVALDIPTSPYATFVQSIPYRFYPIFTLILGLSIAASRRDMGAMLRAERRALKTGKVVGDEDVPLADYSNDHLEPPEGTPLRAWNAVLPILAVAVVTVIGLYQSGSSVTPRAEYASGLEWIRDVFSNADSYKALLWASMSGMILAMVLPLIQRILTVREATEAMVAGFRSMLLALVVLILAWSIGAVCKELHTADYLVGLTSGILSPYLVPVLTFLLAAAISFATGTAWGTMAILTPLVIPISNGLSLEAGLAAGSATYMTLLHATIASVLSGSVWGDHCSPISDTTILSSMASGCDHIAHVRTQAPYALGIGFLAILFGSIPTAYGLSPWIALPAGALVIGAVLIWYAKPIDADARA